MAKTPKSNQATGTVKVLSPVDHDGVRYEVGELIENISEVDAQALVDVGAAEVVSAQPEAG